MANKKHLEKLLEGVDSWNNWRDMHPKVKIDLSGVQMVNALLPKANLEGADLSNAFLSQANLSNAVLSNANLSNTNLFKATLMNASLSKANLSNAFLSNANLFRAVLTEADLSGAIMTNCDLSEANLSKARLTKANLYKAELPEADLSFADLSEAELSSTNLTGAQLSKANLSGAQLYEAYLNIANLSQANFSNVLLEGADLSNANFSNANLEGANLSKANLSKTNFEGADLLRAKLEGSIFLETNLMNANLENAKIYGVSAWDIKVEGLKQKNLIISKDNEPIITVDNIEVAQFIYLMLNNKKIRDVIGTIANKGVLILGRFTTNRKPILDAIREKLRELDYLPIMFDFEKAEERDFTETIKILAGMAKFVIADITNPSSSPLELQATIPDYKIPFLPIIQKGEQPFAMFKNLQKFPWVLELLKYPDLNTLMSKFKPAIIDRAEKHLKEIKEDSLKVIDIDTID